MVLAQDRRAVHMVVDHHPQLSARLERQRDDVHAFVGEQATDGSQRAEAVKRYLYEQYQVPLHKMNVISYGKDKPIAPNKTKAGRAQNRRVVIKVLA